MSNGAGKSKQSEQQSQERKYLVPWERKSWDEGLTPEERQQALEEGIAAHERYEREGQAMGLLEDLINQALQEHPERILDAIQQTPPPSPPPANPEQNPPHQPER